MSRNMSVFFLFIVFLLAGCTNPDEMIEVKFKLQRGDVFKGEIEVEQSLIQEISSQLFETNQTIFSTVHFTVKDNRKNNLKIDAFYKNISIYLKNPLINIKYDSQSKNNEDELETIRNIINKKITLMVNGNGTVQVEGINPVLNSIIRNNAYNPVATATIISFFNEKQIKNTFGYLFNYLSRKKVKIGNSWSGYQDINLNSSPLKINNKWKLVEINENTLFLNLKARMTGNKRQGDQEGELEIDRQTGWINTGRIVQNIPAGSDPGSIGLKSTFTLRFEKIK